MKYWLIFFFLLPGVIALSQTPIQNFTLQNAADNSTVSLNGCTGCSGVVVIFTSNACAFDDYYWDRIKSLATTYQNRIRFLLINSHTGNEESIEQMATRYRALGLNIPYLADKDQTAMNQLKATRSPEAFLLKNAEGRYTIHYSGAIDDSPQMADDVKQPYLRNAIENMLAGKRPTSSVRAVGCMIRRK